MENNQTYKNRALASLEGKWFDGAIATFIMFAISGGVSKIVTIPMDSNTGTGFSGLWWLLCMPLSWGFTVYFLNLIRNLDINFERLFDGYKDFVRIFLAQFLMAICLVIGYMLFFIPGIIIGLMLSQTSFILKDNPQMSATDAMKLSKQMMAGHKGKLFWLTLSFIGWFLLACLTLGLGFLLLAPYYYSTMAHFYEDLKAEQRY